MLAKLASSSTYRGNSTRTRGKIRLTSLLRLLVEFLRRTANEKRPRQLKGASALLLLIETNCCSHCYRKNYVLLAVVDNVHVEQPVAVGALSERRRVLKMFWNFFHNFVRLFFRYLINANATVTVYFLVVLYVSWVPLRWNHVNLLVIKIRLVPLH